MSAPLRLGFAGVGWIGRGRMEALLKTGYVHAVAIADPDPACMQAALSLAPDAVACVDFAQLLDQDIDGVVIATPSAAHAAQAVDAFDRGMAVFCQKPLGRNAMETERVVRAARRADRRLGVDLSYRYLAGMDAARALIAEGALGQVYAADFVFHNAYGPGKPWFFDKALSGGGCLIDLGIHLIDLGLWLLGNPSVDTVRGHCYSKGKPLAAQSHAVEDYAVAQITLGGGIATNLACSWHLPIGIDAEIGFRIYGSEGGIGLRNLDGSFVDFALERFRGTARETIAQAPDAWGGRALVAWAEALRTSRAFDHAADDYVKVARVMDRIYGSY